MHQATVALVAVLALAGTRTDIPTAAAVTRQLRPHPRLWMERGTEERILQRVRTDPLFASAWARLVAEADDVVRLSPVKRQMTGRQLLYVSRETIRRVMALAMVYRVTGDRRYLRPAKANLLAAAAFTDWNPAHFLDVAEMTLALGTGYDWLFDDLSSAERDIIRQAILEKGVKASYVPGNGDWVAGENNWNQVCHGGMLAGVLAVAEDEPELAARTIGRALDGLPHEMRHYAPDGAYPEGPTYWDYGTTYNVLVAAALESSLGSDFGVTSAPGFLATADYFLHVTGPSGEFFNYADAESRNGIAPSPAQYFLAARRHDSSLLFTENGLLRRALAGPPSGSTALGRFYPLLFVWADELGEVPAPTATYYVGRGDNPVALFRASWDRDASFVGVKGGSPSVNHGHMDVGSFVIDMKGVRFASDLGMQDYTPLQERGLSLWSAAQGSDRWRIFRLGASSHNLVTVDGQPQVANARADFAKTTDGAAVLDLSRVYARQVASAWRGVRLEPDGRVRVQDEITVTAPRTVRWAMVTYADVRPDGPAAVLTRDGRSVTMRVVEPEQVRLTVFPTDPPRDYDAPNPGTRMVGFEVSLQTGATVTIVVDVVPGEEGNSSVEPLREW
jgi:hypothetical protein